MLDATLSDTMPSALPSSKTHKRSGMAPHDRPCKDTTRLDWNRAVGSSPAEEWTGRTPRRRGARETHLQLLRTSAARNLGIFESIQGACIHAGLFLPPRPLRHPRRRQAVLPSGGGGKSFWRLSGASPR